MTELPSLGPNWLIRIYQYLLSPLLGPSCRFTPNCSVYAIEALQQHGLVHAGRPRVNRGTHAGDRRAGRGDIAVRDKVPSIISAIARR